MAESLRKKTLNGVAWSALERFSNAGVSFLIGLLLARLLMPSDYGLIAMLGIFMAISQTFIDSGFSSALIRKPDRTEVDNSTTFYFNIVVGLVCYVLLYFSAPYIADFYNSPELTAITRVMGFVLVLNSLCVVQQALLTIKLDFKTQAKVSLTSTIVSGIVGVVMAFVGYGVWSLVAQTVLNSFIRLVLLWVMAKWRPTEHFSRSSFHELFSYGSKLLASSLLDTVYNNLYTIIIGKKFASASLGIYSRADQFAKFPALNVTGIVQRVTFPVLSTIQNEDERLRLNYRKFLRLSAFVVFPIMIGMAAVAEPMVQMLLTDKWIGCVPMLQILCFSLMWYPIHAINLNLLQVKGRSDLFLKLEVYKKILGVSVLFISVPLGLIAMCIGRLSTAIISLALNTHYTGKLLNMGFFFQMKDLLYSFISSLLMGLIVYVSISFIPFVWLQLLSGIVIGILVYALMAYLVKPMEWKEFILILKRK